MLGFLLFITAVFLILLVLVQRGRGGGLAGALGGMGGSSAFGAKAGDVFTKITIGTATWWILLCIFATKYTPSGSSFNVNPGIVAPTSSGAGEFRSTDEESESGGATDTESSAEEPADSEPAGSEPVGDLSGESALGGESETAGPE